MHGVKRVPEAERDAAKEAAKLAAAAKINALTAEILKRKKAGTLDEESLKLTFKAVETNPEFYTAWNYRRDILSDTIRKHGGGQKEAGDSSGVDVTQMLKGELELLQAAIAKNAKAYCLWTHREWVVDRLLEEGDQTVLDNELELCAKFLKLDERNFHCWGYRLAIGKKAKKSAEQELAFTGEKIDSNFSNYSAWHYRSQFLQQVHMAHTGGKQLLVTDSAFRTAIEKEAELVQGAVFTDPADQSSWIYLRWIVSFAISGAVISRSAVRASGRDVVLTFSHPVSKLEQEALVASKAGGTEQKIEGRWEPILPRRRTHGFGNIASDTWLFTPESDSAPLTGESSLIIDLKGSGAGTLSDGRPLGAARMTIESGFWRTECPIAAVQEGAAFSDWAGMLDEQLEQCSSLLELEPESKWALTTKAYLLSLKHQQHLISSLSASTQPSVSSVAEEISEVLQNLQTLDTARANYYKDQMSRITFESKIQNWAQDPVRDVSLSSLALTKLHQNVLIRLSGITKLDVSNNFLRSTAGFHVLHGLQTLVVDNNCIDSLWGLSTLVTLLHLSARNNKLQAIDSLDALADIKGLEQLDVSGNSIGSGALERLPETLTSCTITGL